MEDRFSVLELGHFAERNSKIFVVKNVFPAPFGPAIATITRRLSNADLSRVARGIGAWLETPIDKAANGMASIFADPH